MAEDYCAPWCAAVTTPYPICPQLRLDSPSICRSGESLYAIGIAGDVPFC